MADVMIPLPGRRAFLRQSALGLAALATLFQEEGRTAAEAGQPGLPHFPPKAKRVIYLFQSGAPSQMDLFDYKPKLQEKRGEELPESIRRGQRLTGMTSRQESFPVAPSRFAFARHGQSGAWVSELLPHTAKVVDDLCFIRSMHTEAINHDPAITMMQTGSQLSGRPSIGAWLNFGLGSDNENLPAFVVLITPGKVDQPLYSRLWGSGFLPTEYQGVQFRSGKEPVLYLANPSGVSSESRRLMLDRLREVQEFQKGEFGDREVDARIAQYEMSYRMQASVPGVMDLSNETEETFDLYGKDSRT